VAFTYLKVKSAKYLCLLPVDLVLVLLFWSWFGLKNMVFFTSLIRTRQYGYKSRQAGYVGGIAVYKAVCVYSVSKTVYISMKSEGS